MVTRPNHIIAERERQVTKIRLRQVRWLVRYRFLPLAAKLLIGSKKLGAAKMARTSFITMPGMVGIVGRAPAVDEKVWCFLSRFGMTTFVITETLWCSAIFKTVMVSLHRGRFVVVHLYSTFSVNPQNFPYGQICTKKLPFFTML